MANNTPIPEGIYSPVPTFFKGPDFELDLNTQIKHAKLLYDSGINGVVVSGSMGESNHLTQKERLILISTIRKNIPDTNFKVIAGMPLTNIVDTIEEIAKSAQLGADYLILLVPGYYGPRLTKQSGIIKYFESIGNKSELPIIIYNYPGVSNSTDLDIETFERLLEHPAIVGVKLTHFNMDKFILLSSKENTNNFRSFSGLGQILLPSLCIGCYGAIDGLSGVFPKVMMQLFKLCKDGRLEEAKKLQYLITDANKMVFDLNLVGVKHTLKVFYNLGSDSGRPPLNDPVDLASWKKYESSLKALESIEKSL